MLVNKVHSVIPANQCLALNRGTYPRRRKHQLAPRSERLPHVLNKCWVSAYSVPPPDPSVESAPVRSSHPAKPYPSPANLVPTSSPPAAPFLGLASLHLASLASSNSPPPNHPAGPPGALLPRPCHSRVKLATLKPNQIWKGVPNLS